MISRPSAARAVGRALSSAPAAGALVLVAAGALEALRADVAFMGHDGREAIALVFERARWHAVAYELGILAVLAVLGAAFGMLGALCGRMLDVARGRPGPRREIGRGIAGVVVTHGFFLAHSVVEHPQLYSARLFERRGLTASLMVALTTHASPRAVTTVACALLAALLLAPLATAVGRSRVRAWVERAFALPRRARPAVLAAIAVLGLAAWFLAGRAHGGPPGPRVAGSPPNVVLIAVDSLRADRVFSSAAAARFPTIAGIAGSGVRFRQAYVTQARTFPSFVTLLTGRYPKHHGIRHEFPTRAAREAIGPSLPAVLRDKGWRTAAVSDFAGEIFSRLPIGFSDVDAPHFDLEGLVDETLLSAHLNVLPYAATSLGERVFPAMRLVAELDDPSLVADRAETMIDRLAGEPFFLTVFFSGTHTPYVAPAPYYARFADPAYEGPYRYLKEPLPLLPSLPASQAKQVQALYDGAVLATDDAIARVLRRLDEDGLADRTIIVLLGDHGENLFDVPGRGLGHGDHLATDFANHIPLVVVDPTRRFAPHDVDGIVRDVDLAPTLAGLVGVVGPPGDGVDLAPMLRGERASLDLEAYSETGLWLIQSGPGFTRHERLPYPSIWEIVDAAPDGDLFLQPRWEGAVVGAKHYALRTPRWKVHFMPTPDGPRWRLFDMTLDPFMLRDVADEHPAEMQELRGRLEAWISDQAPRSPDLTRP